ILTQGIPPIITARKRFERIGERLQWTNTLGRWVDEIELLSKQSRLLIQTGRRVVLIDVTNSASDPSNSGVINVTRQLASRLSEDSELFVVFGIWDPARGYALPTASHRLFLESYAGPEDWMGRVIEKLGVDVPLERVLDAADPRCTRSPVLF